MLFYCNVRLGLLESSLVGPGDELLESEDLDDVGVFFEEVILKRATRVEVAQSPTLAAGPAICTAEDEVRLIVSTVSYGIGKTHELEGYFLLSGAAGLLPFQRNEKRAAAFFSNGINPVTAAARPLSNLFPSGVLVSSMPEGMEDHVLQDHPGSGVSRAHYRFFTAMTSRAGVRSPVQLIFRGARRNLSVNPSFL